MLTINKKTMLIGWVIGVGSGLFMSGIILSILLYTSNKFEEKQLVPTLIENTGAQESVHNRESQELKESKKSEEFEEPKEASTDVKPIIDSQTIEIEIDATATARQIAKILEENGVISNSDEFLAYIISKNITRGLIHGKKIFTLNSDNESALKVLTSYK